MGLFENIKNETVRNLNLRDPIVAKPDELVRDVVLAMRDKDLGCAIIVDVDRRPIGMFTESILTRLMATQPESLDDKVSVHAADHWAQVKLTDPISSVLETLEVKNIRFLSVVDDEGVLVGLTGQKGLMEFVAEHFPTEVPVQRLPKKPYLSHREGA